MQEDTTGQKEQKVAAEVINWVWTTLVDEVRAKKV